MLPSLPAGTIMDDEWDEDDELVVLSPRRRRWRRWFLLLVVGLAVSQAPRLTVVGSIRDWPLRQVFMGLAGQCASGSAEWQWLGPIVYHDLVLTTTAGEPVLAIDRLEIPQSPFALAFRPTVLGRVRVSGLRLTTAVWHGGSTIETVLTPWVEQLQQASPPPAAPAAGRWGGGKAVAGAPAAVQGTIELRDATLELVDLRHGATWWLTDVAAEIPLTSTGTGQALDLLPADLVVSGRVHHVASPQLPVVRPVEAAVADRPLTAIASHTAAVLARAGGWSVTVAAGGEPSGQRSVTINTTQLPAGISLLAASRWDWPLLVDGLFDVRADIGVPLSPLGRPAASPAVTLTGSLTGRQVAICEQTTLAERFAVDRLEAPFACTVTESGLTISQLAAETTLGSLTVTGELTAPGTGTNASDWLAPQAWKLLEQCVGENLRAEARLDLAALGRAGSELLPLRPDVRVTGGTLDLLLASQPAGEDGGFDLRLTLADLTADQGVKQLTWDEPCSAWLRAERLPNGRLRLAEAGLASAAAELTAMTRADAVEATWRADLEALFATTDALFDLQPVDCQVALTGMARGRLAVGPAAAAAASTLSASASLEDCSWTLDGRPLWQDEQVAIDLDLVGGGSSAAAFLDRASLRIEAGSDLAAAALAGSCVISRNRAGQGWPAFRSRDGAGQVTIDCRLAGALDRWESRVRGALGLAGVSLPPAGWLQGVIDSTVTISAADRQWQVTNATGQIEQFSLRAGGWQIEEPRVLLSAAGSVTPDQGRVELSTAELLSATLSVRTKGLEVLTTANASQPPLALLLASVRGQLQWQAEVSRLQQWWPAPVPGWEAAGRLWGTAALRDTPAGVNLLVETTGSQLALTAGARGGQDRLSHQPRWAEPQVSGSLELTRPAAVAGANDRLIIDRLAVESSTLGLLACGSLTDLAGQRQLELGGTLAANWNQLMRLLAPAAGGMVQLVGSESRPFSVQGSLGPDPNLVAKLDDSVELPLPKAWQPGGRGDAPASGQRLIALPLSRSPAAGDPLADWLRTLAAETTLAWQGGRVAEFPLGPGELPLRMFEGQVAVGPFDIPVSGGRIRGAPWVQLLPLPGELVLPPGRIVERVTLTPALCDQWLGGLSPLLRRATQASGRLSFETSGGRLPLADPYQGQLSGRLLLEDFTVTPGDMAGPLVKLLAQLQSVVDPRFAFGDRVVLLRARPQPVDVHLADGQLHHDNLVLDMGQLTVRSRGRVGEDGSLAMQLEVAFRGDLAGATPVVAQLLRTPLVIPLRGTVQRPQFDASAIDTILGRIMEHTADAVLRDGIGRGLEALFGNPQPPRQPQPTPTQPPLVFPPTR